ncbi:MAG: MGMT family protein, partial [Myxococcota bacterium]|nr:MGMT family protein [Myxococcota bacterium]
QPPSAGRRGKKPLLDPVFPGLQSMALSASLWGPEEGATLHSIVGDKDEGRSFYQRVYELVRSVPSGSVTTYGDVAAALGNPRMARQVGWALSALGEESDVPWQRVINSRGSISFRGEFDRAGEQLERLAHEGVHFSETGRCNLEALRWWFPDLLPALDDS